MGILLGVPIASAVYALVISWLNNEKEVVTVEENVESVKSTENNNEN